MSQSGVLTLAECVDEYLINRMIDKKKNYAAYMVIAKRSWQKMFWNTIYSTQSVWQILRKGYPYDYVELPKNVSRFFTAAIEDRYGKIQPLFYNNQINIIPKPTNQKCSCTECKCDGLCEDLSSTSVTTKLLFTINGVDYFEKTYIKTCPNGDVIKWREVPTKSFNDRIGQTGDYNNDFNNDFSNQNASTANFSIVTETFQEKICKLEVKPCGCVTDTPKNIKLINDCCSGFFQFEFRNHRYRQSNSPLTDTNSNGYGSVKMSECGTRLYFIPTDKWRHNCNPDPIIPAYLLLNYQTNGISCTSEALIPEYGLEYMHTSIDYNSKRFNNKFSGSEKQQAKYEMNDAENRLIMFLNPLNLQQIANTQDSKIVW